MPDYSQLVKAYDIRGIVPAAMNTDIARRVGAAFAELTDAAGLVIARDMRDSSPDLAHALAEGAASHGADVIDAGLGSTDYLYYASGALNLPGAMITASHNPAAYNGIKLCRAGAAPVGADSGLDQIRSWLEQDTIPTASRPPGSIRDSNLLTGYAQHLRGLVDLTTIRPLTVVVDAGNGMAGHTVPAVLGDTTLPALRIIPMYFDLDGSFPHHEANPLDPANLVDLQHEVVRTGADIGLAFDGDADRCFVIDEHGHTVSPSAIIGLIATRELAKHPGASIVHNVITSAAAAEIIREHGGTPIRSRVGHSFMKRRMADHDAIFGGEHSGHYYFRDFWRADTGMLAAMHVLAALGEHNGTLSALTNHYDRYISSGEINNTVPDITTTLDTIEATYQRDNATTDRLDGLTVWLGPNQWFNLRPSNTEPLLRLNVEAPDHATMTHIRDHVLTLLP